MPLILLISAVVIIIAGLAVMAPMIFRSAPRTATIRIPANATMTNLSDSLTRYLGADYAAQVVRLMKMRNVDVSSRNGAYEIKEGTSPFMAMRRLSSGAQTPVRIVINGFRSLDSMAESIAAKVEFNPADFVRQATDSATLATYGLTPDQALALFLNDTYEVYWTSSPAQIIRKIGRNYSRYWNPERVQKAQELELTPAEVTIVASLADEETNRDSEKGRIGRLYINRLDQGMRLQSDPTVRYALGDFTIQRITTEHLAVDSPYNTYRYDGLPPGPLRTPSQKTIDAVLDSEPTNEIYMCAKEDFSGYHNFASTYSEHVTNAMRYRHELDRRGIK